MSITTQIRSIPFNENGLTFTTPATAWLFSPWKVIWDYVPEDAALIGISFETNFVFSAADTTQEHLFEIGFGEVGNPTTKVQIPHSCRSDTAVGFYLTRAYAAFLPEPLIIPHSTTVSIRVARSIATAVTYAGVKLLVQSNKPSEGIEGQGSKMVINSFMQPSVSGNLSTGERMR